MVQLATQTLMSSGRKEYSATKITAYFSPKSSPAAKVAEGVAQTPTPVAVSMMPAETRRRAAQAQVQAPGTPDGGERIDGEEGGQKTDELRVNGADAKPARNVDKVVFGDLLFECSYTSRHVREIVGDKVAEGKEMLGRLCVCPHCFKYTQEIVKFLGHRKVCERRPMGAQGMVPGKRVYRHGMSGWEVWEVDGEHETLYCQNLSLFAKLFLGDKSVSFDVSSFIFYLLVHRATTGISQVVGFFSKEKQSWDDNNLACILIFPPWQRKGLGTILMGLSYEMSRREGLIGGPEKPLSELGKRGYLRFWSGEIARWLLAKEDGTTTSVEEISNETWILKEDCMDALREMGIIDENGRGQDGVTIYQKAVRDWVERTKASVLPTVDKDGWLEEYYCRERPDEDMEDESEE